MNVPTTTILDRILVKMGSDSTMLGSASMGLIAAPFTPAAGLTIADITEANFTGYVRKAIGNPTIPFTSVDGLRYVEGTTGMWMPSDTVTPNVIYGIFLTPGSDTVTMIFADKFAASINLPGPGSQVTVTPRFAQNPAGNFGLNVISN